MDTDYPLYRYFLNSKALELGTGSAAAQLAALGRSLADEATTRAWVEAAIAESGAGGPGDMGKVMGALMKLHKGEVDGNIARGIAQELLAGSD